jgi:hypothetical protein
MIEDQKGGKGEETKRMVEDTDVLALKPRETLLYIG